MLPYGLPEKECTGFVTISQAADCGVISRNPVLHRWIGWLRETDLKIWASQL